MTRSGKATAWIAVATTIVVFLAVADALSRFAGYAADPYQLWRGLEHDRNGHFGYGLEFALSMRDFDVGGFLLNLERAKVWPPFHGLLLAATMLAGGIDLKLAIVPSLIGYVATVVLVWLIALRLFPDTLTAMLAGAISAGFVLISPAFRLITADVMLDGLGAALSCLCLYLYLRAREMPDRVLPWRLCALALTALFFHKFNYWLMTLVPLAIAFVLDQPPRVRAILTVLRDGSHTWRGELRQPLTIAGLVVLAVVIAVQLHGPLTVIMFGSRVSLYPPGNLLSVAYILLFARAAMAWWPQRDAVAATLGVALRQLGYWHALPVAVSFLIPKRLGTFLWFVGPTHHHGRHYNPWLAAQGQWDGFANGFHVMPGMAVVVALGALLALFMLRRAGSPLRTVALVATIGLAAVVLHPQQQQRFLTTVMPSLWIMAGAGWALLFAWIVSRLSRLAAASMALLAVVALAAAQIGYPTPDKAYAVAIHPRPGPSDYELYKFYRPYIAGDRPVAVLFSIGRNSFAQWTLWEDCKCRRVVQQPFVIRAVDSDRMREIAAAWLATTGVDTIVAIDANIQPLPGTLGSGMRGQFQALEQQTGFAKIAIQRIAGVGDVTVWRRKDIAARPGGGR